MLSLGVSALPSLATSITIPYTFSPNTVIVSAQVNANFSTIAGVVNGNIDNSNLSAGANISLSKLNLTQSLLNLQATGTSLAVGAGETGDTVERVGMLGNGQLVFGPGTATAVDVGLTRTATGTLQVNNASTGAGTNWDWNSTPMINFSGIWGGNTVPAICGGRAYLGTGAPFTDGNATGTLYYGPATSNIINLAGTIQTFAQVTLSTGSLSGMYDLYATTASSTTITLSSAAWGGINTPPTRSADQYGRPTKNSATGSLLVAVFYVTGANQTVDNTSERFISNVYNPIPKAMFAQDTTASWTYGTATFRAANANTTDGQGRVSFVSWLPSVPFEATCFCTINNAGGVNGAIGLGLNSTSAQSVVSLFTATASDDTGLSCSYAGTATTGFNYLQRMEYTSGATTTYYYTVGGLSGANGLTSWVYN